MATGALICHHLAKLLGQRAKITLHPCESPTGRTQAEGPRMETKWQDIPGDMPVYSIQGGPLDAEDNEPVLVATDFGKVFLVVPEQESPGVVRYQIFMAGWWLEESEGKPIKWARIPVPAGLSVRTKAG